METLVLDGKNYVKASKAARDLGYATDYVGQLCRSGKVTAHLIGRTWYVNPDELSSHRTEKKRQSRVKAREQAHKSIEAHRVKISATPNVYKNIGIQYEQDSEDLIPQTRKLNIQSAPVAHPVDEDVFDDHPTIINKGEKVRMSGDIAVVDVTDGVIDNETTVLTPTAVRTHSAKPKSKGLFGMSALIQNDDEEVLEEVAQKVDFTQKLQAHDVALREHKDVTIPVIDEVTVSAQHDDEVLESRPGSVFPYILIILAVLLISIFSIPFSHKIEYVNDGAPITETSFNFSIDKALSLLRLKI